jgi:hypothetical protein
MKEIVTDNQLECAAALEELCLAGKVVPIPPNTSCSGIMALSADSWLLIENTKGVYRMTLLLDATKEEAWSRYDALQSTHRTCNFRAVFTGYTADASSRN